MPYSYLARSYMCSMVKKTFFLNRKVLKKLHTYHKPCKVNTMLERQRGIQWSHPDQYCAEGMKYNAMERKQSCEDEIEPEIQVQSGEVTR